MTVAANMKPSIFYASKSYIATVTDTDTLADGFYGTVILNKGTALTLTLGTAANNSERPINIINIGAGAGTISDGATIITLAQYEACTVACNGSDWYITGAYQGISSILTLLLTVDGDGSGLDADLLDGHHYSDLPTSAGDLDTRWEPLTNGDPGAPELVFDGDGDVIMVEVSN